WLVGSAVIVVLIVIMTVVLVILQRSNDSTEGGSGDPSTSAAEPTTQEEPTEEEPTEEEPTEEEPTDDGGGDAAGFTEATCEAFDQSKFEELYGEAPDPDESYTSASSSGDTGSLSCNYYTTNYDSSGVYVYAWGDSDSAMDWWEDEKETWSEDSDYVVTDYTAFGDAGYHMVFGEGDTYQKRSIHVVVGGLEIDAEVWIYPDEQDPAVADEYLQSLGEQAAEMFADYV
ncbi:hypothetical protein, partial [Glycomyces tenuis]